MPVGRLFTEIGKNVDRMNESMRQALTTAQATGPEFAKITAAGQSLIAKFQDALNPTKKFKEQLDLLKAAGMSQSDVWKVMGDDLSKAADKTKQMGQAIDPAVKKMLEFGKSTEGSKFSFESLGKSVQDFASNPIEAAKSGMNGLLGSLGSTAVGIGAVATAAIAAGTAIFKFVDAAADNAKHLQTLSTMTGLSTQDLQAMEVVAKRAGVEGMDLGRTISYINQQLAKDPKEFRLALQKLGVDVREMPKDALQLFDAMGAKLKEIPVPTDRAQRAMEALGVRYRELIPLMLNLDGSIRDNIEQVKSSGQVYGGEVQEKLIQFHELVEKGSEIWRSFKISAIGAIVEIAKSIGMLAEGQARYNYVLISKEGLDKANAYAASLAKMGIVIDKTGMSVGQFTDKLTELQNLPKIDATVFADPFKITVEALDKFQARMDAVASGSKVSLELLTKLALKEKELKAQIELTNAVDTPANRVKEESLIRQVASLKDQVKEEQRLLDLATNYKPIWTDFKQFNLLTEKETASLKEVAAQLEKIRKDDELQPISGIFGKKEDFWLSSEGATFENELPITKALNEGIKKTAEEHKRQYQKMIESVRDGAGQVFDAMVSRGKGAFSNLGDWIEGFFLTRLRKMFENLVLYIMQGFKGGFAQVLAGVIPGVGMGGGGGFGGFGFSGLGGMGTLGAMAGGLGLTAGMMMPGPLGLKLGTGIGAGLFGGAGMISAGLIPGMGAASFGSALSFLGSGAGLFGSTGLLGLGALTVPIIGAVVAGLPFLIKSIMGKSTEQAGAMEVTRDLGGLAFGKDQFKSFFGGLGLSESDTWGIRKDLIVSPKFLAEIAGPIAEAQGKMNSFLAALEKVQTSWGNFDFRKAYEVGKATGDWTALNKAFEDAFEHSEKLREEMPNWKELLAAPAAAAKTEVDLLVEALTNFRDAVQGSLTPVESMYDTFLKTGEVTDELAKKITELGGDLSAFQGLKPLLDQSAGLQAQIGFIQSLTSSIAALAPELDPINQLLSGKMGPEAIAALTGAKLDPAKFTNLMDAISAKNSFNFQPFQTLTPELQSILSKYGGEAGQLAIEKYAQGFNTITQALLASTKATMDEAYQNAVKDALQYLGEQQKEATDKLQELIDKIDQVKQEIINQSNIMLGNAKTPSVTEPNLPPAEENPNPGGSGGGSGPGKEILPTSVRDRSVNINFYGPVYGAADFDARVQQAKLSLSRQGAW